MKVLITDGISSEGAKILTEAGLDVCQKALTPQDLVNQIGDYDCIIVRSATKVTKDVIDAGKKLKVIARGGVGVDNIDVHAESKKILVLNTPGASAISVAELTIAHMLAVSRFLHVSTMEMRQGKWPKKEYGKGIELYRKTLGSSVSATSARKSARRALGMGMHVLAYDPPFAPMDFVVDITTRERLLASRLHHAPHAVRQKHGPAIGRRNLT